jgi:hypothetical protein
MDSDGETVGDSQFLPLHFSFSSVFHLMILASIDACFLIHSKLSGVAAEWFLVPSAFIR